MSANITIFAHRGASGYLTENTLESFNRAIELGATWIECDARAVNGRAVVFHDRTLARMAGVNRHISKEPLNSLVNIELKGGGKIPLLEQALECARGRAGMQIELKGVGVASAAADDITRAIASGFKQEQLLVSSFDQQELFNFKRLMPGVPLGLLVYGYPLNCLGLARELGVISVHVNCDFVTANRVSQLKAAGYKVYVYTVNDLEELKTLLEMGVDGVFSDFPDKMLAASLPAA